MRLLTRSDFDGLACAVLLNKVGIIDSYKFVHPKDLQDGLVEVNENDCLANVPFVKGCGLWFDHHLSEKERNAYEGIYHGRSEMKPSCARVIYEYYGGKDTFAGLEEFIEAVDKVDSANLTIDDIKNPKGYVLLGFIMDPRTGLGRFRDFRISNYQLMENMIEWCATKSIDEILHLPDVLERVELYNEQSEKFVEMVKKNTTVNGKTIITDLRGEGTIYAGNRFMIYSLYPQCNLSVWIVSGKGGVGCSCAVGYSVLNRTCDVNVGSLMLKYGGGGHKAVGTCQFTENVDEKIRELIADITILNK
ncbi:MAG: exopolyphosphatase [Acholeplasmatales bacterium]|nr:exopolyphosphatase [Acholeplasmatales bacterium]